MNTDIAEQTLKVFDRTFRSFYDLINAVREGNYQQKIQLPDYLTKEGYIVFDPLTAIRCDRPWGLESARFCGLKSALQTTVERQRSVKQLNIGKHRFPEKSQTDCNLTDYLRSHFYRF